MSRFYVLIELECDLRGAETPEEATRKAEEVVDGLTTKSGIWGRLVGVYARGKKGIDKRVDPHEHPLGSLRSRK